MTVVKQIDWSKMPKTTTPKYARPYTFAYRAKGKKAQE